MLFKRKDKVTVVGNYNMEEGDAYHMFPIGSAGEIISLGANGWVSVRVGHLVQHVHYTDLMLDSPSMGDDCTIDSPANIREATLQNKIEHIQGRNYRFMEVIYSALVFMQREGLHKDDILEELYITKEEIEEIEHLFDHDFM